MGFRSLNASIKKIGRLAEQQRKVRLKARTMYDWLVEMQKEYLKQYNQPDDFTLEGDNLSMKKNALDFCIIYQSNNTRLMNPVARKEIKALLKNIEKQLESQSE